MAGSFQLSVITPEREFFKGEVESLTVETVDGQLCVLASHVPMATALSVGIMKIKKSDGETVEATHTEGFLEVRPRNIVTMLVQACEWPHEIDALRAEEALKRAAAYTKGQRDEEKRIRSALLRATVRLRLKYKKK